MEYFLCLFDFIISKIVLPNLAKTNRNVRDSNVLLFLLMEGYQKKAVWFLLYNFNNLILFEVMLNANLFSASFIES